MKLHRLRSTDGSGTLTYILNDGVSNKAVILDPNLEDIDSILALLKAQALELEYVIDTHTHADHKTGAGVLRERLGAKYVMHENTKDKWQVVELGEKFGIKEILKANAEIPIDRYVDEGDVITSGELTIKVLHTPGHTDNHLALYVEDSLFTGDLLLIGQAGRSDLPGGNPEEQYDSLYNKVLRLPPMTKIYPGHDYEDNTFSYLKDESRTNPFLQKQSREEFVDFVREYFPPIADADATGKVVLQCGTKRVSTGEEKYHNLSAVDLFDMKDTDPNIFLLDVREPSELESIGAIPGVVNISSRQLAARLQEVPKDRTIVAICHSGGRSAEAAHLLVSRGYTSVYNLLGGTMGWLQHGYPVQKRALSTAG